MDACALVMDSYLAADPAGQKKTDAIVIEACQRGQSASFRFAQRYGHSGILRRLKPSAPFEYLGTCAPLLV
ncbi:MAG: hypothetical protein FJX76_11015 [Armatimonadetes bacterium]|nr:hypothetical protein [Armatimonadota bacterium]